MVRGSPSWANGNQEVWDQGWQHWGVWINGVFVPRWGSVGGCRAAQRHEGVAVLLIDVSKSSLSNRRIRR
jgi:hypothetical protein